MIDQFDLFVGYYTACSFKGFLPKVSSICASPASLSVIIFLFKSLAYKTPLLTALAFLRSLILKKQVKRFFSFIFVNLRNVNPKVASNKCHCSAYVRLLSSYMQKRDWKGHVVNLPIWTWVIFFNTCYIRIPDECDMSARSHYIVKRWGGAMNFLLWSRDREKK